MSSAATITVNSTERAISSLFPLLSGGSPSGVSMLEMVAIVGLQLQNNKWRKGEDHSWISSGMTNYHSTSDNAT